MGGTSSALRVLFIGNSFTFFHNMPVQVATLAGPRAVEVGMLAESGAALASTWRTGRPRAALRDGAWDVVVLQEHSTLGDGPVVDGVPKIADPAGFHQAVRQILPDILAVGAAPLLYLTWAKLVDPAAQEALTSAYREIGAELGIPVAPVGEAWAQIRNQRPDLTLHDPDGSHSGPTGAYLTACVFHAVLTNTSPVGAARRIVGPGFDRDGLPIGETVLVDLSERDAVELQETAWKLAGCGS